MFGDGVDRAVLEEGGVGKSMAERAMDRPIGKIAAQRILHVAMDHPDRLGEAVSPHVLLGHHRVAGRDLDSGDMDRRHPGGDAERCHAGTHSGLEQGIALAAGNARRQQHRVDPGTKPLLRLEHLEAAAKERILGERGRRWLEAWSGRSWNAGHLHAVTLLVVVG